LWSNKFAAAEHQFRVDLASNKNDAAVWRGLGWTSYFNGDTHSALGYWARAVELAPTDWSSAALWPTMANLATNRDFGAYEAAAAVLASTPGVRPEVAWSARLVLAHRADRIKPAPSMPCQRPGFGYITSWRVIGPFDNVSKSGFDKVFPPEQVVDFNSAYTGKDDLQLKWRTCPLVSEDDVVAVSTYIGDSDPDIYYAVTAVNAPSDMDVVFRFASSGASKMYVDGKLTYTNPVYCSPFNDIPDAASFPVHLTRGWNPILVKAADEESVAVYINLRVTDAKGAALPLPADASHGQGLKVNADATPNSLPSDAPLPDDIAESIFAGHLDTIEGAMMYARYANSVSAYERGEAVLRRAIIAHPQCAALHYELSEMLKSDDQDDDSRAERTIARGLTSRIAENELNYLDDEKSNVDAPSKVKALRALMSEFPNSFDVAFAYASALDNAGMNAEGYNVALRAYKRYPGESLVKRVDDYLGENNGHDGELLRMYSAAVKVDPIDDDLVERYARILYRSGNYPASLKQYLATAALHPELPYVVGYAADVCDAMDRTAQAISLRKRSAILTPQSGTAQSSLASEYEKAGRKSDAIAAYQLAIRLDPSQVDLRDKLQILTGQKPVIDMIKPIPTPNLDKLRGPGAGGAPSTVFLVDDTREVVYPDYVTQSWAHEVIKINDQAAASRYQYLPISYGRSSSSESTVERAVLLKAGGKTEDHTSDATSRYVSFPSLAPGDIIDVTYRVVDHTSGELSHNFWTEWAFGAAGAQAKISRLALITPVDMDYRYVAHGGAPDPIERKTGTWRIREWSVSNGPEYKYEYHSVPDFDWVPWVDISTVKSWTDVVRWYEDLSSPRCQPDVAIAAKAAELTKDDKTNDDKIRSLVRYVSHDVRYQSTPFRMSAYVPTEGKQVIREQYGDCKDKAALLTAMLSTLGIKSRMVLLSPSDYGLTPYLPSPRFAHAIALVDTPQGQSFIDGTADGLDYGDLPWGDQGAHALVIDTDTAGLKQIPYTAGDNSLLALKYTGTVKPNGDAIANIEMDCHGNKAWALRSMLNRVTKDQQQQALRGLCSHFGKMQFVDGSLSGLDDPHSDVHIKIDGNGTTMTDEAGDFLLVTLPWSALASDMDDAVGALSTPDRRTDLNVGAIGTERYHIDLKLPDGYTLAETPSSVNESTPWESLTITYSFANGILTGDMEEKTITPRIGHADLPKFVDFIKKYGAAVQKKVVLKKSV